MSDTTATPGTPGQDCGRDAPKTYYATQGTTQISAPSERALSFTSGAIMPTFYGALCDKCAHELGLSATAFGRSLEATS